nr:clumping factor A-like [Setaria viridis]
MERIIAGDSTSNLPIAYTDEDGSQADMFLNLFAEGNEEPEPQQNVTDKCKDHWEAFVQYKSTEDSKNKVTQNTSNAGEEYHHKLGFDRDSNSNSDGGYGSDHDLNSESDGDSGSGYNSESDGDFGSDYNSESDGDSGSGYNSESNDDSGFDRNTESNSDSSFNSDSKSDSDSEFDYNSKLRLHHEPADDYGQLADDFFDYVAGMPTTTVGLPTTPSTTGSSSMTSTTLRARQ